MQIARQDLDRAAAGGLISAAQADALWQALAARAEERPSFGPRNVALYLGALVVIGAMGWLMTEAWERLAGPGIFAIAACYALAFAAVGWRCWTHDEHVPGGLLVTMAVAMVPLAVYGLERWTGLWPLGDPRADGFHVAQRASLVLIDLGTIVAGLVALRFVRFPFLTAPIAFALWCMSMHLTPLAFGRATFTWNEDLWVSLVFGFCILAAARALERRAPDFAFWGYLFGMIAFWGGLSLMDSHGELAHAGYLGVNLVLIAIGAAIDRRVFVVFGAFGVVEYLSHLARLFSDSLLLPLVVSLAGLAVLALATRFGRGVRRLAPRGPAQ